MRIRFTFLALFAAFSLIQAGAQQANLKKLQQGDVASWKQIQRPAIANSGRWVAYALQPNEGDPSLHAFDEDQNKTWDFPRADRHAFSSDSRFLVFMIKPDRDSLMAMRRRKAKKEDLPVDTLGIFDLGTRTLTKIPNVQSFQIPSKWPGLLAYHLEPGKSVPRDTTSKSRKKESADTGSRLVLLNLNTQAETSIPFVKSFALAEEAPKVLLTTTGDDAETAPGIYVYDPAASSLRPLYRGKGNFKQLSLNKTGSQAAFIGDLDTTKIQVRPWGLYHWKGGADTAKLAVAPSSTFLPKDWTLSEHASLDFSKDGSKLFFGIAPAPILKDTSMLEEEIVQVEVWNYQDPRIFPQQKVQLNQDRRKSYTCVLHTATSKVVQLGSLDLPDVQRGKEGDAGVVVASTNKPYAVRSTWEGGGARDVYLVDVLTGKGSLVEKELNGFPQFSPEGKYLYWYSSPDTAWFAYDVAQKKKLQLTSNKIGTFYDELNDVPDDPSPHGVAGWTTNDDFLMVYDRYDLWLIDPTSRLKPANLTNSRKMGISLRYIKTDPEERAIEEVKPLLLHFTNEQTLDEGYMWFDIHAGSKRIVQQGAYDYGMQVLKAKQAMKWAFTRGNYQTFPDLHLSDNLTDARRISNANPQQAGFGWGSIELHEWTSLDGQKLRGLLVKPAGFDPAKKYPMIVNFYERSSEGLHAHRAPEWNRSQINYTYYASRGYLVFNPDIPYKGGYPGESAFNSLMAGVTSLIDKGFVDRENVALQGHSWGGYQIAYLLTRTNLFKCAESGAPVVNMISAYGGVRWESGLSRMFQYEKTQSRIGAPIWDKPLRYIENSPIFFADKINTPVLILHNDADGAVPWYQGIEFYMAMRRLGKPAWMLNYNGEPHWPVKLQNRKDFQLRMEQFFDHYLQGAPMPKWMRDGVPAIEQGIRQGFELIEEK